MATSSSLSSAKFFTSFISTTITRRGFASAGEGLVVSSGGARSGAAAMAKSKRTGEEKIGNKKSETVSWVPDPVTGCYRPENQLVGGDVDAAEMRAVLLNQKN